MKILIMKFRNIGDVLLITPLLENLKLAYPNALIDVAINKGTEEMISLNPNLNDIIIYDRNQIKSLSFFQRIFKEIVFALKIRKAKYNLVINTTEGDRGAQLTWISGAKIKIGYQPTKNWLLKNVFTYCLPPQEQRHTIECNLDVLRILNLPIKRKKVTIFWNKDDEDFVKTLLPNQDFIHIHPVSRWLFKCINDKTMAQIIDYCQINLQTRVILTASSDPIEMIKLNHIYDLCQSKPMTLAGKLTLKQTAYLNKQSKFFIGVDTAIMHISAANDIPVLAFFGPSGADHWGPWDNHLIESGYTSRKGFRQMGKHRVIQENRDCVPCGKDGCFGSKVSDCLMNLDLAFIYKNLDEMAHIHE